MDLWHELRRLLRASRVARLHTSGKQYRKSLQERHRSLTYGIPIFALLMSLLSFTHGTTLFSGLK